MKRLISWSLYILVVCGLLIGSSALLASTAHADTIPVEVMTIIGECSNCTDSGMEAVANVIRNRALKRHISTEAVCLQRLQFSCWNGGRARLQRFVDANESVLDRAYTAWQVSESEDITGNADHYFADYIKAPSWSLVMDKTVKVGHHIFYSDKRS